MTFTRRALSLGGTTLAALTASGLGVRALGQDQDQTAPSPVIQTPEMPPLFSPEGRDGGGRLTVPVRVNGRGPFIFAVDSAANGSMISREMADFLQLPDGGEEKVHTLIGYETVQTARVDRIECGSIDRRGARLVLGTRDGLGVDGLIGTDMLRGQRLYMNFLMSRTHISDSRPSPGGMLDIGRSALRFRAPAEQRFGNLLMIDAHSGRTPMKAIVDTGAQVSIINMALARAAMARPIVLLDGTRMRLVKSPTGLSAPGTPMLLELFQLGGVTLTGIPVLAGDFHVFDLWGLSTEPAMLMGVDIMKLFKKVVIDLARGELVLQT